LRIRLYAVVPVLLCLISCGAFADPAADLKAATDLIAAAKYDEAIKLLSAVQSADPVLAAQTLELTGDCYRLKLAFAEAAGSYEGVLSKYKVPADQGARIRRWLVKCHIRDQEWAKVEAEVDADAAESPAYAASWYFSLGKRYLRVYDFGNGVPAFDKAIEFNKYRPNDQFLKDARKGLVQCLVGASNWDRATDLIKKLSTDYPEDAAFWHECAGGIYQGQAKYKEAIAELKQTIDPEASISARKRLGECYRDSLAPAEAAPLIMDLAEKHPKDGPYLPTEAGKLYQGLNEYDKAIAAFKFLVANCPDARWQVWDACCYIGECCYAQGKGEEALAYIKGFYAKHPDRPMDFAIALGRTLRDAAHKPAEAAQVLAKAVEDHPRDPLTHDVGEMAIALLVDSGQSERAAGVLEVLIRGASGADKPRLMIREANTYYGGRHYREALGVLKSVRTLKDAPDEARAEATYRSGLCYQAMSYATSARMCMERVLAHYPQSQWAASAEGALLMWSAYGTGSTLR
jgi:tetratricopeptide (TPR) repeat protein